MNSRLIWETTPEQITPAIVRFANMLNASEPRFLPVQPSPRGLPLQCYFNVQDHIETNSGESVEGWLIWEEARHRWLLANHHAVWCSPTGEIIDVTPQKDRECHIVFCPGSRKWDGRHQVASVFEPLVRDRCVRRFCEVGNELQRWLERNTAIDELCEPDLRFVQLNVELAKLTRKVA